MKKRIKKPVTPEQIANAADLAYFGQSNKVIKRETDMTDGQIAYRLHEEKIRMDLPQGLRMMWRNGMWPIVPRIIKDHSAIIRKDMERRKLEAQQ